MSADDFFSRWSKRKAQEPAAPPVTTNVPAAEPAPDLPPPTLEEVAALGHDADFSRFVKPGVDETVRRSAMKKLFTDPHFNVMDGLDIYIDDYNKFEPIPAAMLAMLAHAKPLLDPLGHLQQPAMAMLDRVEQLAAAQPADDGQPASAQEAASSEASEQAAEELAEEPADEFAKELADAGQASENPAVNQSDNAVEVQTDTAAPRDDHTI